MAINSKEYKRLIVNSLDILPLIKDKINLFDLDKFIEDLNEIRTSFKKMNEEFESFRVYPKYNLTYYYTQRMQVDYICSHSDIKVSWIISQEVNEQSWEYQRKCKQLAKFMFEGVDITGIINF